MSDVWRPAGGSPAPEQARPPSLDDLLRQVSRGDEAAFERLYDQLAAPVFGLVRRVVRDRAQAEDVLQRHEGRLKSAIRSVKAGMEEASKQGSD